MPIPFAAKAAASALKDERVRKGVGKIVIVIIAPAIFAMTLLVGLLSVTSEHNNAAVKLCFNNEAIPAEMPIEYAEHIASMRVCFTIIDIAISYLPLEGELNDTRVKSVFYSLYFDRPLMMFTSMDAMTFVQCFVRYEVRVDYSAVTDAAGNVVLDADGNAVMEKVEYTVAVPVGLTTAYSQLAAAGIDSTEEQRDNAAVIYRIVTGGGGYLGGMGMSVNMSDAELYEIAEYYGVTLPDIDTLSVERRNVLKAAFAGVDINIPHHYDWRSYYRVAPGIDENDFWSTVEADYKGRTDKGLDCSGFVGWAFYSGGASWSNFGFGELDGKWHFSATPGMRSAGAVTEIDAAELFPGDVGFISNSAAGTADHTGVFLGTNSAGTRLWLHCGGSTGAVCSASSFAVFYTVDNMDQTFGASRATFTEEEIQWLAALIYYEGRGYNSYCKELIATVAINRVGSAKFPNTLKGVLQQSGQYGYGTPGLTGTLIFEADIRSHAEYTDALWNLCLTAARKAANGTSRDEAGNPWPENVLFQHSFDKNALGSWFKSYTDASGLFTEHFSYG